MMQKALGLIETIGLTAAIEAADAAVKAANVQLLGYENTKGGGKITIKLVGDVGAVQAAVSAGAAAAGRVGKVYGCLVIPRPHEEIAALINNVDRGKVKPRQVAAQAAQAAPVAPRAPAAAPDNGGDAPFVPPDVPKVTPPLNVPDTGLPDTGLPYAGPGKAAQCAAITKSGQRCRIPARPGSRYCNFHKKLDETA